MTAIRTLFAAAFAALMVATAAVAGGGFEGVWKVKDSAGTPFEITLNGDGSAKGTLEPEMTGTWKVVGDAAEIEWSSGWKSRIAKEGGRYKKSAFKPGTSFSDPPANTSDAEKVK